MAAFPEQCSIFSDGVRNACDLYDEFSAVATPMCSAFGPYAQVCRSLITAGALGCQIENICHLIREAVDLWIRPTETLHLTVDADAPTWGRCQGRETASIRPEITYPIERMLQLDCFPPQFEYTGLAVANPNPVDVALQAVDATITFGLIAQLPITEVTLIARSPAGQVEICNLEQTHDILILERQCQFAIAPDATRGICELWVEVYSKYADPAAARVEKRIGELEVRGVTPEARIGGIWQRPPGDNAANWLSSGRTLTIEPGGNFNWRDAWYITDERGTSTWIETRTGTVGPAYITTRWVNDELVDHVVVRLTGVTTSWVTRDYLGNTRHETMPLVAAWDALTSTGSVMRLEDQPRQNLMLWWR